MSEEEPLPRRFEQGQGVQSHGVLLPGNYHPDIKGAPVAREVQPEVTEETEGEVTEETEGDGSEQPQQVTEPTQTPVFDGTPNSEQVVTEISNDQQVQ